MTRRLAAVVFLAAAPLPAPAIAQRLADLPAGARVRVTTVYPRRRFVAMLEGVGVDSVTVLPDEDSRTTTLALTETQAVEVSRPPVGHGGFGRGAAIGAGVGLGVTAVAMGFAAYGDTHCECDLIIPGTVIVGAAGAVLTVVTTIAGGAIGYSSAHHEQWRRVWPPR